jgi:hypothetical protein
MKKIEGYLINLGITYEEVADNTWVLHDPDKGLEQVAIAVDDPLVVIRVNVMQTPKENREEFYRTLLTLNASDLVHGAYALEDENVLLIDTLQHETMDLEDFQASLDAVSLALTEHYTTLKKFRT